MASSKGLMKFTDIVRDRYRGPAYGQEFTTWFAKVRHGFSTAADTSEFWFRRPSPTTTQISTWLRHDTRQRSGVDATTLPAPRPTGRLGHVRRKPENIMQTTQSTHHIHPPGAPPSMITRRRTRQALSTCLIGKGLNKRVRKAN